MKLDDFDHMGQMRYLANKMKHHIKLTQDDQIMLLRYFPDLIDAIDDTHVEVLGQTVCCEPDCECTCHDDGDYSPWRGFSR
jgi:hypothetical protein